jgi:hypothetical protein
MEPGADKCIECDSFQDWTRYVVRYTSVAAAVLGIIPAFTIAASLYEIAFGSKSADLRAALIRCSSQQIDMAFANLGKAPAIVVEVTFRSPDTKLDTKLEETLEIRRPDEATSPTFFVDPGGSVKLVSYQPFIGGTKTRFPQFPVEASVCRYHISISSIAFSSRKKAQELICDCYRS